MAKSRAKKSSARAKPQEEEKGGKKRKRGAQAQQEEAVAEEREEKRERLSRERKQVDRYCDPSPRKILAPKNPTIEQGPGVKLRDIPNVLSKLSKRKIDDNLHVLHTILFGRKSNVRYVKRNILQFSGFVWAENEEKEKAKAENKLEKCAKDKLLDFCQLLDIPVNKKVTKKEAIERLLEFLKSPCVSSDVVIEEKEKEGKKRKRMTKTMGEGNSDKEEIKKQKRSSKSDVKTGRKQSAKANKAKANKGDEDGDDTGDPEENNHAKSKPLSRKKSYENPKMSATKSDKSNSKSKGKASLVSQSESKELTRSKKVSLNEPSRKGSKSVAKEKAALLEKNFVKVSKRATKSSRKSASTSASAPHSTSKSIKVDNKKGRGDKPSTEGKKASKIQTTKPKLSAEEKGKRKVREKAIKGPSRQDMLLVVSDILKEVDFKVVTLADILKQLETHFKVSLMDRKGEVKSIIGEAVTKMSDFEDTTEEEEDNAVDAKGADNKKGSKASKDNPVADTVEDPQEEEEDSQEEEEDPKDGSDDGDGDK